MNAPTMRMNPVYASFMEFDGRYAALWGGAGSGKSVAVAQKLVRDMVSIPRLGVACYRKQAITCRHSTFAELVDAIEDAGLSSLFDVQRGSMLIRCKLNGSYALQLGLDDVAKRKSIRGIQRTWLEEATEMDEEDYDQTDIRMRGSAGSKQLIVSFNPVDYEHWLRTRVVENPDVFSLHTTVLDNVLLDDDAYTVVLDRLAEQNENMWRVYRLGEWGSGLRGLIYPDWREDDIPRAFDVNAYADRAGGLDFGHTHNTALVEVRWLDDATVHVREWLWEPEIVDIADRMEAIGWPKDLITYADAARPDEIERLRRAGFRVVPALKTQGSVWSGIMYLKGLDVVVDRGATGVREERRTYTWREDRSSKTFLDEPVKFRDDALDALRYAAYSHRGVLAGGAAGVDFYTGEPAATSRDATVSDMLGVGV